MKTVVYTMVTMGTLFTVFILGICTANIEGDAKPTVPALTAPDKPAGATVGPTTEESLSVAPTRAEFDALKAEVAELRGALKTLANEPRIFHITQPIKEREKAVMQPVHIHQQEYPAQTVKVELHAQFDDGRAIVEVGEKLPIPIPDPPKVQTVKKEDGKLITESVEDK